MAFYIDPFRTIYVLSNTIDAYFIANIMHSWNIIKNKVSTLSKLFQTFLMQKWVKEFLDDFVCIINNHNYVDSTLRRHRKFLITICWGHTPRCHCQIQLDSQDLLRPSVISHRCGLFFQRYLFIDIFFTFHSCTQYMYLQRDLLFFIL